MRLYASCGVNSSDFLQIMQIPAQIFLCGFRFAQPMGFLPPSLRNASLRFEQTADQHKIARHLALFDPLERDSQKVMHRLADIAADGREFNTCYT